MNIIQLAQGDYERNVNLKKTQNLSLLYRKKKKYQINNRRMFKNADLLLAHCKMKQESNNKKKKRNWLKNKLVKEARKVKMRSLKL